MGEVVNLRRARKATVRATATNDATANRALHGRTLAERAKDTAAREQAERALDGSRRED